MYVFTDVVFEPGQILAGIALHPSDGTSIIASILHSQSRPLLQVGTRSAVPTALVCLVKADCPTCKMAADSGATTNVRSSIGLDDDDPAGLVRCALPEIECV
jgi:hypothetical protein